MAESFVAFHSHSSAFALTNTHVRMCREKYLSCVCVGVCVCEREERKRERVREKPIFRENGEI